MCILELREVAILLLLNCTQIHSNKCTLVICREICDYNNKINLWQVEFVMCLLLDIEHLSIKCCNKSCNNTKHNSWIHTTTLHIYLHYHIRFHGAVMPTVTPSAMLSAAGSQCHGGASLPGWECSAVAVWCWHLVWQQQLYIMESALANIVLVAATVCMWVKLATLLILAWWVSAV